MSHTQPGNTAAPQLTFAHGVSAWPTDEQTIIVVDSDEQFVALSIEEPAVQRFFAHDFNAQGFPRYQSALEGLRENGYLVPQAGPAAFRFTLTGEGVLADAVRLLLHPYLSAEQSADKNSFPLLVRDTALTPAEWNTCAPTTLPVFGEGASVVFGPWRSEACQPAADDDEPGLAGAAREGEDARDQPDFSDLVQRRLAAHPAPDMLTELWHREVDQPGILATPSLAVCHAAASRLRWELDNGLPFIRTHQIVVHPDLSVTTHRVLPMPDPNAWCPARPTPAVRRQLGDAKVEQDNAEGAL